MTLYDLRVENQTTPLGLGEFSPRFSWKVRESQNGFIQKSYRIQVSLDDSFVSPVWDSGDVATSESHLVPYAGPALAPRTRYLFRVMGSGVSGETSGWSEPSWFETAFEPGVWSARFISPEGADNGSSSRPKAIRKTFTLPFVPTSARAYATALGLYELCVNGKKAGDAVLTPGWTVYQKRVAYQTYDVTNLLVEGANTVSALVAPGWYKGEITWFKKRNLYGNRLAFSAFIEAKGSSGESLVLSSDESWEAADTALLYAEIYHGETYDARLEGTERWTRAEPVPTPKIDIVAQDGPPVVKNETFRAKRISTPAGGEILDFGQNLTGWVKFAVKGKKGQRIVISHAETLDAAGNFYTANMRGARNRIEYILKGKVEESFEPRFSFQGFRYIRVEGWRGKIDPDAFTATAIHSRMRQTLDFECSHSGLNQLHHNILWGWKGNAVDIPTDCPQRDERLGWTGDAQVFVPTAARLCQVDHFFRKWLRDLRADQLPDGAVPHVIPDVLRILNMPDPIQKQYEASTGWADASVIVPWEVYVASGDVRLLEESWPSMKAWVDYIRVHARNGVLWDSGFHFGDWVALDAKEGSYFGATPNDLTATAYYAYSAGIVSRVAGILGKDDAREEYSALHDSIVDAFQTADQARQVFDTAIKLADAAVATDDFEAATRCAKLAGFAAYKAKDGQATHEVTARSREIDRLKSKHALVQKAFETLQSDPSDGEANLTAGQWTCFVKGNWGKGLPMLAKGSRAELADLAKRDLAQPSDAKEQAALADAWWARSEKESATVGPALQDRAKHWYEQAAPNVTALEKTRIERRLEGTAPADPASSPKPSGKELAVSVLEFPWTSKSTRNGQTYDAVIDNLAIPGNLTLPKPAIPGVTVSHFVFLHSTGFFEINLSQSARSGKTPKRFRAYFYLTPDSRPGGSDGMVWTVEVGQKTRLKTVPDDVAVSRHEPDRRTAAAGHDEDHCPRPAGRGQQRWSRLGHHGQPCYRLRKGLTITRSRICDQRSILPAATRDRDSDDR